MIRFVIWACLCSCLTVLIGCASTSHEKSSAPKVSSLKGLASWYGPSFHGNLTANGEVYDMWALTAAHRTLPFGTWVVVESVRSGKSVTVRINDRGPFIRGRVIDLSYGAARALAMIGAGTEEVLLTILDAPDSRSGQGAAFKPSEPYWVQAASFATLPQAVSLRETLSNHYPNVRVMTVDLPSGQWHRVQIGEFNSPEKAKSVVRDLKDRFDLSPLLMQDN